MSNGRIQHLDLGSYEAMQNRLLLALLSEVKNLCCCLGQRPLAPGAAPAAPASSPYPPAVQALLPTPGPPPPYAAQQNFRIRDFSILDSDITQVAVADAHRTGLMFHGYTGAEIYLSPTTDVRRTNLDWVIMADRHWLDLSQEVVRSLVTADWYARHQGGATPYPLRVFETWG